MPNIAVVFRDEMRRLAKKEVRPAVAPLKKKVAELTRTNAAWKRMIPQLERTVARLEGQAKARQLEGVQRGAQAVKGVRIGPRSIAAQRRRLKLTRAEFGRLAGVSANTIYLWETGEVSPRDKSRAVLVELRKIGAREAKRLLAVEKPEKKRRKTKGKRGSGRRRKRR